MKFDVFTQMEYIARSAGTLILNIHALRSPHQTVVSEVFNIDPYIKVEEMIIPGSETRLVRFEIPEPGNIKISGNKPYKEQHKMRPHFSQRDGFFKTSDVEI